MDESRLLIVSNRLPVTVCRDDNGNWQCSLSSGGLVSALGGLKRIVSFTWIGWPGVEIPPEDREEIKSRLMSKYSCIPVFLTDEVAELHYNGFSNSIVWPLFHYLPGEIEFNELQWNGYFRANTEFASAVAGSVRNGDLIWIHDYHLMLLPSLLRQQLGPAFSDVKIGFFLHTPFPSSEIYRYEAAPDRHVGRVLPVRKPVLLGLLHSDLIGFHTYDYARHFISSCARILGLTTSPNSVEYEGRLVQIGTFPIGIDPDQFFLGLGQSAVLENIEQLAAKFVGKRVMVGIDRLDYIKGVPLKLQAFEIFLTRFPEFRGEVVLVQVGVPTRTDVEEYKSLRTSVNELVGRINGKFGTINFTPLQFLNRSIGFEDLIALYRVADVCVVTSTRDGMNLVSYEYVASQIDKHGVLILSEFAGAAQSLSGAIIVNPWNTEELAQSYYEALTMDEEARKNNHQKLLGYVTKYTAAYWGQNFVSELQKISVCPETLPRRLTVDVLQPAQGRKCLFLIHLGGDPKPIAATLRHLARNPNTLVYLISGQSRKDLAPFIDVGLVAEHGCFYRHPSQAASVSRGTRTIDDNWIALSGPLDSTVKDPIGSFLQVCAERTLGSVVEEKERIWTWTFGETDPEFAKWQAIELQANLERFSIRIPLSICTGPQSLVVRPIAVDTTLAIKSIMQDLDNTVELVVSATEEGIDDSFLTQIQSWTADRSAPVITIAIGKKRSKARYFVDSMDELAELLNDFSNQ